ncbi:MAG: NAD(P)(+) transhydrogenase (Re/Si-specific) subunit beta [Rhodospirillaceae bacterium]|jgi:H+-translocating NAD(P) transhydrogenase subunit beta|nr:NAD(P)(+) transhydrogenase (Re/Si-specific) subunit beta [Rhodospirillaceae bacterium]MBT6311444.1 NAD(P)(+) transhydrogenase (Re/Si-specific) subunit beta [Rhodospirillaceae bacterium]
MSASLTAFAYLIASVCFIMALRGLSSPKTARMGNIYGVSGMVIAILTTLTLPSVTSFGTIALGIAIGGGLGAIIALKIAMTALPQLVAAFHSLVGLAAVFVAGAAFFSPEAYGIGTVGDIHVGSLIEMSIGTAIGAVTFTGSIIAFGKLQGILPGKPLVFPGQHMVNLGLGIALVVAVIWLTVGQSDSAFWVIVGISLLLGILIIVPIGGADMPVVVSMLNSYSGWAAAGIGFTLANPALIIVGALVGSSGAILSYVMCRGMNRSFFNVILGGFGGETATPGMEDLGDRTVRQGAADDAAFIMEQATKVIIIPGYGMAVAQAQHALAEMAQVLEEKGVDVRYAIHPVAGRMPGHMNVLLAEANVPYDVVFEMDEINSDFASTDVAFVIGANDITNPSAKTDKSSPIYGMPVLNVEEAGTVLFIKRSLASGYSGVDNPLFYEDNTMMLFADAKKMCEDIVKALKGGGH